MSFVRKHPLGALSAVAILLFCGILLLYRVYFSGDVFTDREAWGQFGDYVGGLSTGLFSLLSFLAVLYTLHLQRRSILMLQRQIGHSAKDSMLASRLAASSALMNVYGELMSSKFSGLGMDERKRLRDMQLNLASMVLSLAFSDTANMRVKDVAQRFRTIAKDFDAEQWKQFIETLRKSS